MSSWDDLNIKNPDGKTQYIFGEPDIEQHAVIFDMLSEGEIHGLVDGAASVYLNSTPLMNEDQWVDYGPRTTQKASIDITANSALRVTVDSAEGFFDGRTVTASDVHRICVYGAGESTTSKSGNPTFAGTATTTPTPLDTSIVTASSAFFESYMKSTLMGSFPTAFTIEGAGVDGSDYTGLIISIASTTVATVTPALRTTVTAASGAIALTSKVDSYTASGDYCTLVDTNPAKTSVTNAYAQLYLPTQVTYDTTNANERWNFDNTGVGLKLGTLTQTPITNLGIQIPTASYLYAPNTQIKQNSDYKSVGTSVSGYKGGSDGERFSGQAQDTVVTAVNVGVADASLIDQLVVTFTFPQGLFSTDGHDGAEGPNWSEMQMWFEYQPNAGDAFISKLVFGRSSLNGEDPDKFGWGGPHRQASNMFIISGKEKTAFSEAFTIDTNQFQPYNDWRIRIKKVNADNFRKGKSDWTMSGITQLQTVEAQVMDNLSYPSTAYAAVAYDAKDFGSPPTRQYHIKGIKVQVPTNYITDDEAGAYEPASYNRNVTTGADAGTYQTWDGNLRGDVSTFSSGHVNYNKVYTNNPAWIFYDLCTHPHYGLGNVVTDKTLIDKYALYKIARYCDELVPDGKGSTEPRFTFNGFITNTEEAYKVLQDFASVFRGMVYWMNGKLTPIQDRPKSPIYTFNQTNVMEGMFGYQGTSNKQQPNQVAVSWNNPDNKFLVEKEIVEDVEDIIESNQIKAKEMAAFACTSQGQARRFGEWTLLTNKLENEIVSFQTSENAGFLRPGDIINVQDHKKKRVTFSGRISNGGTCDGYTIPLDRSVILYPDSIYTLHIIFGEGGAYLGQDAADIGGITYLRNDLILKDKEGNDIDTQVKSVGVKDDDGDKVRIEWSEHARVENQIINKGSLSGTIDATTGAITVNNLFVIKGFSGIPERESIWAITSDEKDGNEAENTHKTVQYRVVNISENSEDKTYDISALLYDRSKFDQIESGYSIYTPPYITQPSRLIAVPAPRHITVALTGSSFGDDSAGGSLATNKIEISWDAPKTALVNETSKRSTLNGAINSIATTVVLADATDFTSSGYIKIDNEVIYYTGKSTNNLTGCTRGLFNTAKKSHINTSNVFQAQEIIYPDVLHYEVRHNIGEIYPKTVSTNFQRLEVLNPKNGHYTVSVRTVNTDGQKSAYSTLKGSHTTPVAAPIGRISKLTRGGHMTGSFILNTSTGNVNTAADNYTFTNNKGKLHTVTSATTAQEIQAFSGLSSGGAGYLIHDSSDTTDPWKAVDLFTDNVVSNPSWGASTTLNEALDASETSIDVASAANLGESGTIRVDSEDIIYTGKSTNTLTGCTRGANDTTAATHSNGATVYYGLLNFSYWKEVGASNNGLTVASGTVTVEANQQKVTGSGTDFDGDFSQGDLIRLSSTDDYALRVDVVYGEVDSIMSDTLMYLKDASPRAFSAGSYCYKQSWKPDFSADTITAKITRTS